MKFLIALVTLAVSPAALAYIGPGAGMTLIGSLLSVIGAILLAVVAVLAWPIRKMLKRRKAAKAAAESADTGNGTEPEQS